MKTLVKSIILSLVLSIFMQIFKTEVTSSKYKHNHLNKQIGRENSQVGPIYQTRYLKPHFAVESSRPEVKFKDLVFLLLLTQLR